MTKPLPDHGRIVTVQTKYIGEVYGYAPPETFYVALDDDEQAADAVRGLEDFTPNDDRILKVSDVVLESSSMKALRMKHGEVKRA